MWDNGFWVELWCDFVLEPFSLSLVFLCACLFLKKKKKKTLKDLLKWFSIIIIIFYIF